MSSLQRLPVEVIDKIFSYLDSINLFRCTEVCQLFHTIVSENCFLQYKIKLSIAGLIDGDPESSMSPAYEREQQLQAVQYHWDRLQFRMREKMPRPVNRLYELVGGVAGFGGLDNNLFPIRGLRFVELPSAVRGTSSRQWRHTNLGVSIRDFTMDPVQDLLVLIASPIAIRGGEPRQFDIQVHNRSLSLGKDHPLSSCPIITVRAVLFDEESGFYIRVLGDYVALLFHQRLDMAHEDCQDQLHIWNWKTGAIQCRIGPYASTIRIDSFLFLSERFFVVSRFEPAFNPDFTPCLQVYDFLHADEDTKEPTLCCTYQLPQLRRNALMLSMLLRSDPAPHVFGLSTLPYARPFYVGPDARLLTLRMSTLATDGEIRFVMLFMHLSSLFPVEETEKAQPNYSWDLWGPERTRMMVIESSFNALSWVCYVYGNRYVMIRPQSPRLAITNRAKKSYLYVYDFNPTPIRKACFSSPMETDMEERNEHTDVKIYTRRSPTVIETSLGLFADDVTTTLPFRLIRSCEVYPFTAVMIDEDCIMAYVHEQTADGFYEESLEFLCI